MTAEMVAPQLTQDKTNLDIPTTDMEKLTEVAERGRDLCGRRGLLSLCFYAGAVTAALIVVIALGSMYQQQTMEMCELQQSASSGKCQAASNNVQNNEQDDDEDGDKDGEVDKVHTKTGELEEDDEVITSKNGRYETVISRPPNYTQPMITVVDLHRGLTGIYNSKAEECYLLGGMETDAGAGVQEDKNGEVQFNPSDSMDYEVIYEHPVKDKTLLPGQLKNVCLDKPTFWMQRHTEEHNRQKRRACIRIRICGLIRIWGRYFRRCYYRTWCFG